MGERPMGEWILRFLKVRGDSTHRVSRETLVFACRMSGFKDADDRSVRKAIEGMRQSHPDGPCIVSSSSAKGYFYCTDVEELERARAEDLSRIEETRAKVVNLERTLERMKALPLAQGELPL